MNNKIKKDLVSIIIRTKNEENWIVSCLNAIAQQNYKKFEIIIVDNFSNDRTINLAKKFPVKILKIKKFFPGKAINLGIKNSLGEYIVCLSAHCIPKNKSWLKKLINNLKNKKVGAVYGRQEPLPYSSSYDKRDLLNVFGLDKKIQIKDPFFHNANSAFKKKMWLKFPFDEKITNVEDRVWGKKIIFNNYKIVYEPNASVYHWHGINHSLDKNRADKIIEILEKHEGFFNYNNEKLSIKSKAIAIIPVRGKTITFKNENLLEKTIDIAKKSKFIEEIYVTTDDDFTIKIAKKNNVKYIKRPKILSEKHIDIIEVARYSLNKIKYNIKKTPLLVVLQETYPFRNINTLDQMIKKIIKNNYDTIVPIKEEDRGFWIKEGKKIHKKYDIFIPRTIKKMKVMFNLLGLSFISKIEYVENNVWRNGKINYYLIKNDLEAIEIRNSTKINQLISLFKKFSNE